VGCKIDKEKEEKGTERSGEAAQVTISADARRLQRVTALAKREDELRAEKVNRIKEQILQGKYRVEAAEVAKGIVRSEISRLLGGRAINNKS
jgi:flagellar biosynthesis anti-sigma factor FlgM